MANIAKIVDTEIARAIAEIEKEQRTWFKQQQRLKVQNAEAFTSRAPAAVSVGDCVGEQRDRSRSR